MVSSGHQIWLGLTFLWFYTPLLLVQASLHPRTNLKRLVGKRDALTDSGLVAASIRERLSIGGFEGTGVYYLSLFFYHHLPRGFELRTQARRRDAQCNRAPQVSDEILQRGPAKSYPHTGRVQNLHR
ncbi:hypothetical protein B0H14DRAFT_1242418 [Mycena olivaceomarginata]|nr:hypothetical protein B0H14DRAFT_1242418 [Mycena olivaceomarginata]